MKESRHLVFLTQTCLRVQTGKEKLGGRREEDKDKSQALGLSVCLSAPELLDEVLSLLDDVDGDLQRGLLLLAEALNQVLDGLHGLGVNVVQQLLLQFLQPRPQLETDTDISLGSSFFSHDRQSCVWFLMSM